MFDDPDYNPEQEAAALEECEAEARAADDERADMLAAEPYADEQDDPGPQPESEAEAIGERGRL